MSRTKSILVAMAVVVAFSATAAASAPAAKIFINSKALASGETATLNSKAVVDSRWILHWTGVGMKMSCAPLSGGSLKLVGLDKIDAFALAFEGCSEIEPSTCRVEPANIVTEPLTALLATGTGTADFAAFKPETGNLFVTIRFVGSCSFAGEEPFTGAVKLKMGTGQTEEVAQAIEGLGSSEGNNSLELDKNKAYLEGGKALLSLVSGSKFSFR